MEEKYIDTLRQNGLDGAVDWNGLAHELKSFQATSLINVFQSPDAADVRTRGHTLASGAHCGAGVTAEARLGRAGGNYDSYIFVSRLV